MNNNNTNFNNNNQNRIRQRDQNCIPSTTASSSSSFMTQQQKQQQQRQQQLTNQQQVKNLLAETFFSQPPPQQRTNASAAACNGNNNNNMMMTSSSLNTTTNDRNNNNFHRNNTNNVNNKTSSAAEMMMMTANSSQQSTVPPPRKKKTFCENCRHIWPSKEEADHCKCKQEVKKIFLYEQRFHSYHFDNKTNNTNTNIMMMSNDEDPETSQQQQQQIPKNNNHDGNNNDEDPFDEEGNQKLQFWRCSNTYCGGENPTTLTKCCTPGCNNRRPHVWGCIANHDNFPTNDLCKRCFTNSNVHLDPEYVLKNEAQLKKLEEKATPEQRMVVNSIRPPFFGGGTSSSSSSSSAKSVFPPNGIVTRVLSGAGSGKTTTAKHIALTAATQHKVMTSYIAFNKDTQVDIARFQKDTQTACMRSRTLDSLALQIVVAQDVGPISQRLRGQQAVAISKNGHYDPRTRQHTKPLSDEEQQAKHLPANFTVAEKAKLETIFKSTSKKDPLASESWFTIIRQLAAHQSSKTNNPNNFRATVPQQQQQHKQLQKPTHYSLPKGTKDTHFLCQPLKAIMSTFANFCMSDKTIDEVWKALVDVQNDRNVPSSIMLISSLVHCKAKRRENKNNNSLGSSSNNSGGMLIPTTTNTNNTNVNPMDSLDGYHKKQQQQSLIVQQDAERNWNSEEEREEKQARCREYMKNACAGCFICRRYKKELVRCALRLYDVFYQGLAFQPDYTDTCVFNQKCAQLTVLENPEGVLAALRSPTTMRMPAQSSSSSSPFVFQQAKPWNFFLSSQACPIIIDEAQDLNLCNMSLIRNIALRNKSQLFVIGDPAQSIYMWRNLPTADSAHCFRDMKNVAETLTLSTSFRFGPQIAHVGNFLTIVKMFCSSRKQQQQNRQRQENDDDALLISLPSTNQQQQHQQQQQQQQQTTTSTPFVLLEGFNELRSKITPRRKFDRAWKSSFIRHTVVVRRNATILHEVVDKLSTNPYNDKTRRLIKLVVSKFKQIKSVAQTIVNFALNDEVARNDQDTAFQVKKLQNAFRTFKNFIDMSKVGGPTLGLDDEDGGGISSERDDIDEDEDDDAEAEEEGNLFEAPVLHHQQQQVPPNSANQQQHQQRQKSNAINNNNRQQQHPKPTELDDEQENLMMRYSKIAIKLAEVARQKVNTGAIQEEKEYFLKVRDAIAKVTDASMLNSSNNSNDDKNKNQKNNHLTLEKDITDYDILYTTAHQSKGKEWDVVVVTEDFTQFEPSDYDDRQADEKLQKYYWVQFNNNINKNDTGSDAGGNVRGGRRTVNDDEINTHYVANTRAKKELVISNSNFFWLKFVPTHPNHRHMFQEAEEVSDRNKERVANAISEELKKKKEQSSGANTLLTPPPPERIDISQTQLQQQQENGENEEDDEIPFGKLFGNNNNNKNDKNNNKQNNNNNQMLQHAINNKNDSNHQDAACGAGSSSSFIINKKQIGKMPQSDISGFRVTATTTKTEEEQEKQEGRSSSSKKVARSSNNSSSLSKPVTNNQKNQQHQQQQQKKPPVTSCVIILSSSDDDDDDDNVKNRKNGSNKNTNNNTDQAKINSLISSIVDDRDKDEMVPPVAAEEEKETKTTTTNTTSSSSSSLLLSSPLLVPPEKIDWTQVKSFDDESLKKEFFDVVYSFIDDFGCDLSVFDDQTTNNNNNNNRKFLKLLSQDWWNRMEKTLGCPTSPAHLEYAKQKRRQQQQNNNNNNNHSHEENDEDDDDALVQEVNAMNNPNNNIDIDSYAYCSSCRRGVFCSDKAAMKVRDLVLVRAYVLMKLEMDSLAAKEKLVQQSEDADEKHQQQLLLSSLEKGYRKKLFELHAGYKDFIDNKRRINKQQQGHDE